MLYNSEHYVLKTINVGKRVALKQLSLRERYETICRLGMYYKCSLTRIIGKRDQMIEVGTWNINLTSNH